MRVNVLFYPYHFREGEYIQVCVLLFPIVRPNIDSSITQYCGRTLLQKCEGKCRENVLQIVCCMRSLRLGTCILMPENTTPG